MPKETKPCIECKFYKEICVKTFYGFLPSQYEHGCCAEDLHSRIDNSLLYRTCSYMRRKGKPCGPEGNLFQEK